MTGPSSAFPVDLSNCDREPIHIPGAIQPHGVLLAVREPDLCIVQVSANSAAWLGRAPAQLLGVPLSAVFDAPSLEALRKAVAAEDPRSHNPLRIRTLQATEERSFDGIVHRSTGCLVVELEPASEADERSFLQTHRQVREAISALQHASRVLDLCQTTARHVSRLTGFDRVMVYRFDANGHGHVIAESKREDLETYLDLHYPASDIPAQARRLYLLNWLRLIPDVGYQPAPIENALPAGQGEPLDLSFSTLRSVSKVHVEYLQNMGVSASMSISLVVEGALWGLVICHHYAPRFVRYDVRNTCELLAQMLSWQVAARERADVFEQRAACQATLAQLVSAIGRTASLRELGEESTSLLAVTGAAGVALRSEGSWTRIGQVPAEETLERLLPVVLGASGDGVFATDGLSQLAGDVPVDDEFASGVLAFSAAPEQGDVVMWMRPEVVETVKWAGAPHKGVAEVEGVMRLSPRGSFALWCETVRGRSLPWQTYQVDIARDLRRVIVERERRRLAELASAQREADVQRARLRLIFEQAPVAVSVLAAPNQTFEVANLQYERLVARQNLVGKTFREAFPELPDDAPVFAMVDRVFETGIPFSADEYEVSLAREDGELSASYFLFTCQPLRGARGDVEMVITVAVDVTNQVLSHRQLERARAEAARGEAQFRALAASMPQMVWRTRPDGFHDYYNERWYEYTGLSARESEGAQWADPLHPDDRERSRERWLASLHSGAPFEIEYRFRRHDGVYRWFLGRALSQRDPSGQIECWFGTCTDIDDKKRAERSLRVLAETGAVLASPLNVRSTIQSVAQLVVPSLADWASVYLQGDDGKVNFVAGVHVDPQKELLLHDTVHRYPARHDEQLGQAEVVRTGRAQLVARIDRSMLACIAQDREHLRVLELLAPRSFITVPLATSGRAFGALTFVVSESGRTYDGDDLRLAEEIGRRVAVALDSARMFELGQRERRRAEEANRAKDEFLGVASHELRTPLNAILGWARMLRIGGLDQAKQTRALETIERNAKIQVQLIEDILDVSRIITGKLRLQVQPVDMVQVIDAAADVVRPAADARSVRVQLLLDPSAGTVHGDPERLQQVVWNLLSNAVKFSDKQGRVHVRLMRVQSHVEIVVADHGRGIELDFLPHVFEPFRQADATSTRSYGGLGLGLAIVKHLVELHGGTIEAHSDGPGRGSTFTVRIPIAPVRSAAAVTTGETARAADGPQRLSCPPELMGLKVLVVDDQPDARDLLQSVLSQCAVEVVTAPTAREALVLLAAHRPDVIVSDIGMPEVDGYSLIASVRALSPEAGGLTPAIALTAYSRMEDRTRALMEGFTNHISKPVDPQELIAVLAAAVGRRRTPTPTKPG